MPVKKKSRHHIYLFILGGIFLCMGAVLIVSRIAIGAPEAGEESPKVFPQTSKNPELPQEQRSLPEVPVEDPIVVSSGVEQSSTVENPEQSAQKTGYPWHKGIMTTLFWVGEEAGDDNKNISNLPSAWDEEWAKHYGGVDSPRKRDGYHPAKFSPKENPFYFALPFNDFDKNGKRKKNLESIIPWFTEKTWTKKESALKNRWIRIVKDDKTAYAQWEDVGPFRENDAAYVFGDAEPVSKANKHAGLDLSPAVHDYLGLGDMSLVDWQFVDEKEVPEGPWKETVTTSQVFWK